MKKILLLLTITLLLSGCNITINTNNPIDTTEKTSIENTREEAIESMNIIIDNKEYEITLDKSDTTKELYNKLPLELNMNELNGNEKYAYLDFNLKTDAFKPNHINAGDVMLYGDNCLVIFYKSFDTSYSYTKIGHIDNLPDLGDGSIKVRLTQ